MYKRSSPIPAAAAAAAAPRAGWSQTWRLRTKSLRGLLPPRLAPFLASWLLLTALVFPFDQEIADWLRQKPVKEVLRPALTMMSFLGRYPVHLVALAILVALPGARRLITGYAAAMLGSTALFTVVKIVVGRARPGEGEGAWHFALFHPDSEFHSFPSGEATSALALATLLGLYFPRSRWLFWALGAWTALGRVASARHFLSDAIFGGGLGILCVLAAAHFLGPSFFRPAREGEADSG